MNFERFRFGPSAVRATLAGGVIAATVVAAVRCGQAPSAEPVGMTRQGYTLSAPNTAMLNATTPPVTAVAAQVDGRLRAIGLGTDHQLWQAAQTSGDVFAPLTPLPVLPGGISATSSPAEVLAGGFQLYLFVRGTDSSTYFSSQSGINGASFGTWSNLGGWSNSAPSAAVENDNRVALFIVGADEGLWINTETSANSGTFGGWTALVAGRPAGATGFIRSDPVAARRADGRLDVFFRVGDGSLAFARQDTASGAGFSWHNVPSVLVGNPAPAGNRVYVTSQVNDIWEATDNGANGYTFARVAPNPSGVTFLSTPVTVPGDPATGVNNTVFVVGSDRAIWHITRTSTSGFGAWTKDGGGFNGNVPFAVDLS